MFKSPFVWVFASFILINATKGLSIGDLQETSANPEEELLFGYASKGNTEGDDGVSAFERHASLQNEKERIQRDAEFDDKNEPEIDLIPSTHDLIPSTHVNAYETKAKTKVMDVANSMPKSSASWWPWSNRMATVRRSFFIPRLGKRSEENTENLSPEKSKEGSDDLNLSEYQFLQNALLNLPEKDKSVDNLPSEELNYDTDWNDEADYLSDQPSEIMQQRDLRASYAFIPRLGKKSYSFSPRLGKRTYAFSPRLGKRYYAFSPRLGKRVYSFSPRLGKRKFAFSPRLGKRIYAFSPRLGKRTFSFSPRLGKKSFSFSPRLGK